MEYPSFLSVALVSDTLDLTLYKGFRTCYCKDSLKFDFGALTTMHEPNLPKPTFNTPNKHHQPSRIIMRRIPTISSPPPRE